MTLLFTKNYIFAACFKKIFYEKTTPYFSDSLFIDGLFK